MLQQADTRGRLQSVGSEPAGGSVAEVQAFVRNERTKWGQVIKEANIKLE